MVARSPLDDDWMESRDEMLADVAISLASRVAEQQLLGDTTNGHGGDGKAATTNAEKMVALGHTFILGEVEEEDNGDRTLSPVGQLSYSNDREAESFHKLREQVLIEGYLLAQSVLEEHEDALIALAKELANNHTLIGTDVHELLESHGV
jgi:ATP-dependent Zn protease